jgi:hypothetical protein
MALWTCGGTPVVRVGGAPPVAGKPSDVVTGTSATGHPIATHTAVNGVVVDIKESITTLLYNSGTNTLTFTDETGTVHLLPLTGSSGGSDIVNSNGFRLAVQPILSNRVVKIVGNDISYYEPNVDSPLSTIGLSLTAANAGDPVDVAVDGILSTTIVPNGARWAGPNGTLLIVPPAVGVIHPIGRVSGTSFIVEIGEPIL